MKKRKYIDQAKCIHDELTDSLKKKNPNVTHYVSLLNAELASLRQPKNQEQNVRKLYNNAITISAR
eukprot:5723994-Ditylum_brightwellii.AAC.1